MNARKQPSGRRSVRSVAWGLVCLALLVAGHAGADEDEDDDAVEAAEDVVEIVAFTPAEEDPAAAVDRVTREDLEAAGARTVAEALRLTPGVTLETGARGETALQIRGFDHRQVNVLVDGVPVSYPYDGGLDLSALSAASIEEIRIYRGAARSPYGGGAIGGIVDIRTSGAPREPTFRVRAGGGSGWRSELLASGGGAIGPVRVSAGWELRNRPYFLLPRSFPEQPNEGGGRRENSDRRDMTLRGAVGIGDILRSLELRATVADVRRGVPPEVAEPNPRYWRWDLWRDHAFSLHGKAVLGARVSLRGAAFLRFRKDVLDAYDDGTYTTQAGGEAYTSTYLDRSAGGMAEASVDLGRDSLLESTLSYRHDRHEDGDVTDGELSQQDGDTATWTVEANARLAPVLRGLIGADLHLWQPRDAAATGQRAPVFSADPRAGVVLRPREEFAIRVSGGRRSRFPSLKEMYTSQFGYVVPNPGLRPEHAWTVDTGVTFAPWDGRLVVSLDGHVSFVDGLIERTYDEDGQRSYTNVSRSRHMGLEARVRARPHRHVELELGYDGLHARDTSDDAVNELLAYRPAHRARARIHYRAPFGLGANLSVTLVAPRHYVAVEATGELDQLPAYHRIDASLRQDLGKGFSMFVIGSNLSDTLYEDHEGMPHPGIEVLGGVEFSG